MIFDMDGVITDEARYWQVSRKLSRELTGNEISSSFIRKMKNSGVNSNWEILYKFHSQFGNFDYQNLKSQYNTLLQATSPPETLLVPKETLQAIICNNPAYICTGRPMEEALSALSQLGISSLFSKVYSTEEKSKEQIFRQLDSGPVFSDTVSDIKAAKRAGLQAVGVYGALDNRQALTSAGADVLIKDLTEWQN